MAGAGSALSGVVGGLINNNAVIGQANALTAGEAQAEQTATQNFGQTQANLNPYIQNGQQANNQLSSMTGPNGALGRQFTSADFHQTPGYQFDLQQGLAAINNANSVRGGSLSGGTQKSLSNYAQNQAQNGYQQAYQNFTQNQQQNYQQLSGLSQQGLGAAGTLGQLGQNQTQQMAGFQNGSAMATGNEFINKANSLTGALGGIIGGLAGQTTGYAGSGLSSLAGMFGGGSAAGGAGAGGAASMLPEAEEVATAAACA